MFILAECSDTVRVPASELGKPRTESISEVLNKKLANKVLHNVGLVMSLFDIVKMGNSFIFPGDGATHTVIEFRLVVFRPAIDSLVVGRIRSCTKEGIHVTLDFFDDILIPPDNLQHPSRFDEAEQVWVWEYDNGGTKHNLFVDPGDKIKFRVVGETFKQRPPTSCDPDLNTQGPHVPYSIKGSINEPGLGPLPWWDGT